MRVTLRAGISLRFSFRSVYTLLVDRMTSDTVSTDEPNKHGQTDNGSTIQDA